MEWKKYSVEIGLSFLIPTFSILIIFFSFYSERKVLFFIGIILFVFTLISSIYEKKLGQRLIFVNTKNQATIFTGTESAWNINLKNSGFPIIGAKMTIIFDKNVSPLKDTAVQTIQSYHFKIPFSIGFNQELMVKIPVIAQKRGLAKIRSIEIVVPQIFGFGKTILEYHHPVLQEILVYPKTKPVSNLGVLQTIKLGDVRAKQSLYFDYLSPVGSRDYVSTDSFKQINWKATAKMQKLQTKVFDPIADSGIHLSMNIETKMGIVSNLEDQIEYLTFIIYYLEKIQIPYSITVNFRSHGQLPFYYLPKGLGNAQLQQALKMLAIIDQLMLVYPYDRLIGYYIKHLNTQPFIIHIGNINEKTEILYKQIKKTGVEILYLHHENGEGTIRANRKVGG